MLISVTFREGVYKEAVCPAYQKRYHSISEIVSYRLIEGWLQRL